MPKKLGEFLHTLILKAGQNPDAEPIKNFFAAPQLLDIEVPDELMNALDNNLLSVKDATNNHPEIKKHYDKQILDGVDKVLADFLNDADEEVKLAVNNERSTYKRIPLLINKIKEMEAKKAAASTQPGKEAAQAQKDAYQKQLDQLTFDLKTAQAKEGKLKEDFDRQVMGIKIESKIGNMLGGYKTVYDELPPDAKAAAINALMNSELQNNDAEFFFDEKGHFSIRKKDGTNFLGDNHQQIMPQAFVEQLLSRNKLLKVTTTSDQSNGDNSSQANGFNSSNAAPPASGNGKSQRNHTLAELTKNALNDIKANADFPTM